MTGRKVLRFRWCDQWSTSYFSELLPEINKATSIIVLWFSFVAWNQVFLCKLFAPRSQEDRPICQNLWTFLNRRNDRCSDRKNPRDVARRCSAMDVWGFVTLDDPLLQGVKSCQRSGILKRSVNSYYHSHTFRTYPKHAVCFVKGSEITPTHPQISFHESLSLL